MVVNAKEVLFTETAGGWNANLQHFLQSMLPGSQSARCCMLFWLHYPEIRDLFFPVIGLTEFGQLRNDAGQFKDLSSSGLLGEQIMSEHADKGCAR
jgi:hypothetical protein